MNSATLNILIDEHQKQVDAIRARLERKRHARAELEKWHALIIASWDDEIAADEELLKSMGEH